MGTDQQWEQFGTLDPYFGVCSDPAFRGTTTDPAIREKFFRSGEEHVDRVFSVFRDYVSRDFNPRRALDFGCGVGRVAIPLARRIDEVTGVDVSTSMLNEARQNADASGVRNLTLLPSDDRLGNLPRDFDFVHSFIVFQHIPPARGLVLLQDLLTRLVPGGFGALHLTFNVTLPLWRRMLHWMRRSIPLAHGLGNVLQRRPFRYPLMQMNVYKPKDIFSALDEAGCHSIHLRITHHGAWAGLFLFFQRRELPRF